jgi:cobyrinic acid a,c-diamide synthase
VVKALLVAAPASGTGKTSVSVGICATLRAQGFSVQAFKTGPDYLDPTWLESATGRPCPNLDAQMMGEDGVRESWAHWSRGADFCLIEGAMGLFDGADPATDSGSSAEIARLLGIPVLLVVDASGMARSAAALVQGFARFHPNVRVKAVVANRLGGAAHAEIVSRALASAGAPPLAAWIGKDGIPSLPSRHLGLHPASGSDGVVDELGRALSGTRWEDLFEEVDPCVPSPDKGRPALFARLALAQDEAFFFAYPDNIRLLEEVGFSIVPFSPLRDRAVPDCDALWLPGGYPEAHARELSRNDPMLRSLRGFADSGRPVWAECGGMMLLCREIADKDGVRWPMAGVVPANARREGRLQGLGYREATALGGNPLADEGGRVRGHEFHYSRLDAEPDGREWSSAWELRDVDGRTRREGWRKGNVVASWTHVHLASDRRIAARFAENCHKGRV